MWMGDMNMYVEIERDRPKLYNPGDIDTFDPNYVRRHAFHEDARLAR